MKSFVRISGLLLADVFVEYVMQDYLTGVWDLGFTHAAGILNLWGGASKVLQLLFLFLVDALLGNFWVLLISAVAYTAGIALVALSTPPILAGATGTCRRFESECIGNTQRALLYSGMALVAVGMAGQTVSLKPFLKEQEQQGNNGRRGVASVPTLVGYTAVVVAAVAGAFAMPYIKPWSLRFGIPAIMTALATALFITGSRSYHKDPLPGSPISSIFRVFIAAASNIRRPFPLDANDLHRAASGSQFGRTRFLRCLEKAAIKPPHDEEDEKRKPCTVQEVEEAKIAVRMIPMWLTFIVCGIVSSTANTYFVEQAKNMNPRIGKLNVPQQVFLLIVNLSKAIFAYYSSTMVSASRRRSAPSMGVAIAMVFSILCCIAAAGVEKMRMNVIRRHNLLDQQEVKIPMSMFWLVFQFILLAGMDAFLGKSVAEYYTDQSPESMTKYLEYFTKAVTGSGFMCGVLAVYVAGEVSKRRGGNWFQHTLNRSRLDLYYWFLTALSSVNLVVFLVVACNYTYKSRKQQEEEAAAEPVAAASNDNQEDDNGKFPCCC